MTIVIEDFRTKRDLQQAAQWFERTAQQGEMDAHSRLAR